MAVGAVLALAGLIPVLTLDAQTPPDVVRQATSIYVYHRLDHHLVFHRFDHGYMARHALLAVIWLAAAWCTPCQLSAGSLGQRPLRGFVGGAVAIALVGILIDQTTLHHLDVAAVLLKYYWYRLCDAVLPVGASLAVVGWILSLQDRRPVAAQGALVAAVLAAAVGVGLTNYVRRCDLRPGADRQLLPAWEDAPHRTRRTFEDWRHVCDWIARHTPPDACFITPRMQQTFKWYAGRSEVCSWKDVPQDAASVVAWWERHLEIYPRRVVVGGLVAHGEDRLRALADKYGADYVVLDRYAGPRRLLYPRVYPPGFETTSSSYEVYRIPRAP
jgi:hypothetical protein